MGDVMSRSQKNCTVYKYPKDIWSVAGTLGERIRLRIRHHIDINVINVSNL